MAQSLAELVAATHELRSLPATTARLLDLLDDATVGADEVLDVIAQDPSLTANLLKLCNSAYYGLQGRVGTVREALVMLGNRTVVSLAFATSMGDILRGPFGGYRLARDEMWHHALAAASGAAHLVPGGDRNQRERAFTSGLVHDIGKLILNRPLRERLQQLPVGPDADGLCAAERELLGFDHAEAGAALGEAWNLPVRLVRVVAGHHLATAPRPEDVPDAEWELVRAAAGGDLVARRLGHCAGTAALDDEGYAAGMADLAFDDELAATVLARVPGDLSGFLGALGEPGVKVLFVCTANSCRSQMAEAWARHLAPHWEVASAGLLTYPISRRTRAVMDEAGVPMSGQRPKTIDRFDLDTFDAVVTLSEEAGRFLPPLAHPQRHLRHPVPDPMAATGSAEEVRRAFREGRDRIGALVRDLVAAHPDA